MIFAKLIVNKIILKIYDTYETFTYNIINYFNFCKSVIF